VAFSQHLQWKVHLSPHPSVAAAAEPAVAVTRIQSSSAAACRVARIISYQKVVRWAVAA
jgi:hypothetical protein